MSVVAQQRFVYHQSMVVSVRVWDDAEIAVSGIAAAIGEPARARILYSLMDGRARTSTELAAIAEVSPSTASVHLSRLKDERLLNMLIQGKHRYYSLSGVNVASVLEGLSVLAGGTRKQFVPNTPNRLRAARTCYDHIAGMVGVQLHDRLHATGWLRATAKGSGPRSVESKVSGPKSTEPAYDLTPTGVRGFEALGVDVEAARALRRRFVCACLDWSERRPHLGGALGAALLKIALKRRWVAQELDSRALRVTALGQREMHGRFGLSI
jgi:DNA-binding transcriptional ArsR family regulator